MSFDTTCRMENDPGGELRRAWSGMRVYGIRLAYNPGEQVQQRPVVQTPARS